MNKKWIITIAIIIVIGIIIYFNWAKIKSWFSPITIVNNNLVSPLHIQNQNYNIEVTKQGGAHIYQFDGTNFTGTATIIPFGTKLTSTGIITDPSTYYKVAQGWLDANDVGIVQH